jgi:hypothetical protein
MIWIEQKRVEQNAHQALVAAMRFHRRANILFQLFVSLLQNIVHIDRNDALVVSGQIVRNVFKRQEGRRIHQELTKEQRRGSSRLLKKSLQIHSEIV